MHVESGFLYLATASLCAIVAAFFDIRSRRIPNLLTGPALLAGFALHLALDGWRGLLSALAAALLCGGVFLIFYLAGGMGAGDVKLIAACGCLVGLPSSGSLLLLTALSGGVMALVLVLLRRQVRQTTLRMLELTRHHLQHGLTEHPELNVRNPSALRLPYGLAIAAGCTLTFYLHGVQP
ncbi:MAG TPA: prepilin peptidase [Granulicella sp.]